MEKFLFQVVYMDGKSTLVVTDSESFAKAEEGAKEVYDKEIKSVRLCEDK